MIQTAQSYRWSFSIFKHDIKGKGPTAKVWGPTSNAEFWGEEAVHICAGVTEQLNNVPHLHGLQALYGGLFHAYGSVSNPMSGSLWSFSSFWPYHDPHYSC